MDILNVNNIIAGVESGKITLNLPLDAGYTHEQAKLEDILYPFEISSKKQLLIINVLFSIIHNMSLQSSDSEVQMEFVCKEYAS